MDTISLDNEELFHLAIQASADKLHDRAISHLKQAISQEPSGQLYYLLGAEYAEIGLFDRAVENITTAVELDPSLWTAHLQLSLLHISTNALDIARQTLQPLNDLPESDALRMFKDALEALLDENIEVAKSKFEAGIAANIENAALNNDMQRILDNLNAEIDNTENVEETVAAAEVTADAETDDTKSAEDKKSDNQFLMGKYNQ